MEGTRQEAARLGGERPGRVREAVAVRGQGRGGRPRGLRLAPCHVRVRKATSCLSPGVTGPPAPPPLRADVFLSPAAPARREEAVRPR